MDSSHVEFASDNDKEYGIPIYNEVDAPIKSLTSLTDSTNNFLDEIALLKRGKITRDTPKHTYRRGSAETAVFPNSVAQEGPISLEELNNRGLILGKNRIIYNIPHGVLKKKESESRRSSSSTTFRKNTSVADDSSLSMTSTGQMGDAIHSNAIMQEFYVGTPGEQAKMKISNFEDGISYRLSILDDICLLQKTSKMSYNRLINTFETIRTIGGSHVFCHIGQYAPPVAHVSAHLGEALSTWFGIRLYAKVVVSIPTILRYGHIEQKREAVQAAISSFLYDQLMIPEG